MALLLVGCLLGALSVSLRSHVSADTGSTIGIDMQPGDVPASSASDSQGCVSVNPGDKFNADVFITNVASLTAWELRVDYDPSIVSLESADYNYLLVQSGGQIFPSAFEQEKPGRMFLAAAETSSADSGAGVLARLHMKAISSGASSLQITTNPSYYGPRLTGARGVIVGDVNGDGIFDGAVSGGSVAVGRSCAPATAAPTPQPGQGSSPPGSSPTTFPPGSGGSGSSGDNPTPGSGASGSGADTTPGTDNGVGNGNSHDTQPSSSPVVANVGSAGGSEPTGGAGAQGGDSNTQANNGDTASQSAQHSDGSNTSTLLIVAAAIFAALALLVGAGLILVRPAWRR